MIESTLERVQMRRTNERDRPKSSCRAPQRVRRRTSSSSTPSVAFLLVVPVLLVQCICTSHAFLLDRPRDKSSLQSTGGWLRSSSTDTTPSDAASPYTTFPPQTSPLAPHTFSGMVEQALVEKFFHNQPGPQRVLESWRLIEQGYIHDEFVGVTHFQRDPATSNCKQHCHSYVPGLTIKEFWDIDDECFVTDDESKRNWCHYLQSKYPQILREFQQVTADMETLQEQGNNIWASALSEDASSYGEGWKTLVLMDRGHWDPVNVNLFPVTAKAVKDSGVPSVEVFFASMQPHSQIKMHSDFTNFVLTSHLALDIPYSGQNKCRITVGDEVRQWINGQVTVLDTSLLHDAVNDSDKTRYILMLRLWHPDLSPVEREALQFTYDCLEVPGLVSMDPFERRRANDLVEHLRSFPEIRKGTSFKQGFGGGGSGGGKSSKAKNSKRRK